MDVVVRRNEEILEEGRMERKKESVLLSVEKRIGWA